MHACYAHADNVLTSLLNEQIKLWMSSHRWHLWSSGFTEMQCGWCLSSHYSLWIQTGPAVLPFPHCALYWGSLPNRPWEGAGTCSTLQTSVSPSPHPWSWVQNCGWTASWRVPLISQINRKLNNFPQRTTMCQCINEFKWFLYCSPFQAFKDAAEKWGSTKII